MFPGKTKNTHRLRGHGIGINSQGLQKSYYKYMEDLKEMMDVRNLSREMKTIKKELNANSKTKSYTIWMKFY